jgi:hypothetical protein
MTILVLASPFSLINSFREAVESMHGVLEIVAIVGIAGSMGLALAKGIMYPFAQVSLVSLTIFVGLELGLSFAGASRGRYGLMAVGQATSCFTVVLVLLQFDIRSTKWLTYPAAALVCLALSGVWMLVLLEIGATWKVAVGVGLGAWAFSVNITICSMYIAKHVAPDEYILGVLFILCPEALLCLSSSSRHPKPSPAESEGVKEYGGVKHVTV